MSERTPITVDFETEAIEDRPHYPPKPVGVSILMPGRKPKYYAWGHPEGNNCSWEDGRRIVRAVWREKASKLFHHGKFDQDVAEEWFDCAPLPWDEFHDSMFSLFLTDPHATSLSLKPSALRVLKMKPEEQDAVKDWITTHIPEAKKKPSTAGQYICRAPAQIVGPYANGDTLRTIGLHEKLYPQVLKDGMGQAYDRERRLLHILLENERGGIRVATRALRKDLGIFTKARERAEYWLRKRLRVNDLDFDSDIDVADALEKRRIVTQFKFTKPTKSHPGGQRSISKKNLTPDMFSDPQVASILGYRNRLTTCIGTFMEPWLALAEHGDGKIHTTWNQVRQSSSDGDFNGTKTGRPSTKNPNFLNVPKVWYDKDDGYEHPKAIRLPELPLMRRYLLPDKGHLFLHRDYNQQELRILAHFEDGKLCQAYKDQPELDVHTYIKEEIARTVNKQMERRAVKIINFGMIYGQGAASLAEKLKVDVKTARALKTAQRAAIPDFKDLEQEIKGRAKRDLPIRTWGGRLYYCEEPRVIRGQMRTFEYKLVNYLIQGSAADATKEAVIRYHDHPKKRGRFLVTVYDECNTSAPKGLAKREMGVLKEVMESIEFDVPMLTDGKIGPTWGTLKEFKE